MFGSMSLFGAAVLLAQAMAYPTGDRRWEWTSDDVEHARREANATSRPKGRNNMSDLD